MLKMMTGFAGADPADLEGLRRMLAAAEVRDAVSGAGCVVVVVRTAASVNAFSNDMAVLPRAGVAP